MPDRSRTAVSLILSFLPTDCNARPGNFIDFFNTYQNFEEVIVIFSPIVVELHAIFSPKDTNFFRYMVPFCLTFWYTNNISIGYTPYAHDYFTTYRGIKQAFAQDFPQFKLPIRQFAAKRIPGCTAGRSDVP